MDWGEEGFHRAKWEAETGYQKGISKQDTVRKEGKLSKGENTKFGLKKSGVKERSQNTIAHSNDLVREKTSKKREGGHGRASFMQAATARTKLPQSRNRNKAEENLRQNGRLGQGA